MNRHLQVLNRFLAVLAGVAGISGFVMAVLVSGGRG